MSIVSTIPERCKRCYTCVRECPAKAIKVEQGQATVIEERCIACGNCVKVCAQHAKRIQDSIAPVRQLLSAQERVIACLAPSFPAAFHEVRPAQVVSALKRLGFAEVWEVAFGAELVSREYVKLFGHSLSQRNRVITTPCPAIVSFVSKYMPALSEHLAPIVSPMIATGRAIRHRYGDNVRVVFIGPCIAKKGEITDPSIAGAVDEVLTFRELSDMFQDGGIDVSKEKDAEFDGPWASLARSFAISGGLLRTAGLSMDILENDIVITEGKERVIEALQELVGGHSQACLFDVLFCEGCINGPKMLNELSVIARKEVLARYVQERSHVVRPEDAARADKEFADLDLRRTFSRQEMALRQPTEAEITRALQAMRKFAPEDQLNCGSCGYRTCHDKAMAVCQGLAEIEMCLPYVVDELGFTIENLRKSNQDLASAQQRLVVSERLASMGQLSAGIAHEINNPLGTILVFSHMMLRQAHADGQTRQDLEMIVKEATRCRNIVRGLLDFARQSRVNRVPTRLDELIGEIFLILAHKADAKKVRLERDVQAGLPVMMIDGNQIKQMLINLVDNAIDAVKEEGRVRVGAALSRRGDAVSIKVSDNGCGIAKENLGKLFTPFFTTKQMGKGTGLGLAICYGVVKMHSGDISVDSEAGKGTTFTITLPIRTAEEPVVGAAANLKAAG
jgi:two-component system, NtrC family, sensor kinase